MSDGSGVHASKARIVLIHAVTVAIDPVRLAFARLWPTAACFNLLDDSLGPDRDRDGELTAPMMQRITDLTGYAVSTGADGVLFTCSAFGAAIEHAAGHAAIPVLKPNEAMFEAALQAGDKIGMLATFAPAVAGMEDEFRALAAATGRSAARIHTVCVPKAMAALRSGDAGLHNRMVAEAAKGLDRCETVMLAQFSTAQAEDAVKAMIGDRVLTSPNAAVTKLKGLLAAI